MKGILFKYISDQMYEKIKEYSHLKLKTPEHIIGAIDANIKDTYKFTNETAIVVLDCINKSTNTLKLNEEQTNQINTFHSFFQGGYLYNIYNE